jgi:molybdopterin synthase catalytic subunit
MKIEVSIAEGPLGPASPLDAPDAGAVVVFEGVVRPREGDQAIAALDYSTYDPMARNMLERLAADVARRYALIALRVEHSRGRVGVGERSFRLAVASAHRGEALAAVEEFIDRLKRDVPIWKAPLGRS